MYISNPDMAGEMCGMILLKSSFKWLPMDLILKSKLQLDGLSRQEE